MRLSSERVNSHSHFWQPLAAVLSCCSQLIEILVRRIALSWCVWKLSFVNGTPFSMLKVTSKFAFRRHDMSFVWLNLKRIIRVLQAEQRLSRTERYSLHVLIEDLAVYPENKKWKGQRNCISSVNFKYVKTASTILKEISKLRVQKTDELDPFQGTFKYGIDCWCDFAVTQGIVRFEKIGIARLRDTATFVLGSYTLLLLRMICNFSSLPSLTFYWISYGFLFLKRRKRNVIASVSWLSIRSCEKDLVIQFHLSGAGNKKPGTSFSLLKNLFFLVALGCTHWRSAAR